ncbi:hypothetical protein ONS95_004024 [Cadophora gregata]|uniref:uncharacterized protein n=1 Tax=Cadophora gregata TaxID=51156 RepID=UPI0026DC0AC0|nr:uncharacterized protein ONS95_004024 [Cadophora gregata]KAK0107331.1 hypothetical protein ONS95_004024 [Cadophora gregata]KAK0117011.1 hypothetical protein ONS96_012852 [Cadophora gregata f. sp. sojae]
MSLSMTRSNHFGQVTKIGDDKKEDLLDIREADHFFSRERRGRSLLDLPIEIHLRIISNVCELSTLSLSLTCREFYTRLSPLTHSYDLSLSSGSPSSLTPHPNPIGCRHCVPVLYSPAHCELHYHIRCFFPPELTYCGNCDLFTLSEQKNFSDSKDICGGCGVAYRRRYARGRRFLNVNQGEVGRKRGSRLVS